MSRFTSFTHIAVALLAIAPAALEAQKPARPMDTRGMMTPDITSGFGAGNANNSIKTVSIGTRHSSALNDSNDALPSGQKVEIWAVQLRDGEQVVVTVRSSAFDTQVAMVDPENAQNAVSNDDYEAGSTNSQVTFRAGRSGVFGILVAAYDAAERGAYTLEVVRAGDDNLFASAVKIFPMSKISR